jgi:hypothetical protein
MTAFLRVPAGAAYADGHPTPLVIAISDNP